MVDMIDQLVPILVTLLVVVLIWILIKVALRLTVKVFSCGCIFILVIGLILLLFRVVELPAF
jgi:hypothetical protein